MYVWLCRIALFAFLHYLFPPGELTQKYGRLTIILWKKSSPETAERTFKASAINFNGSLQHVSLLFVDPMISHFVGKSSSADFLIYILAITLAIYLINTTEVRSEAQVRIKIFDYVRMEYMSEILLNEDDDFELIVAKMDVEKFFIDEAYGKFPKSIL